MKIDWLTVLRCFKAQMSFHPSCLGFLTHLGETECRILPPHNAVECVSCVKMGTVKYILYLDSYIKFFRIRYIIF